LSDLRILWAMVLARTPGASHAERLEAFYGRQAAAYDDFRRRLLHGREEMMQSLDIAEGDTLLDLGGGTGSNLEALAIAAAHGRAADCPARLGQCHDRAR
jgi:S-adenosylmethionine-diacylgycerolhomoserine-N-methlytransferase